MFFKRFWVFCLCACFNLAIAKTDNAVVETTGGRVAVLGHSFEHLAPVHPEQVRLVFYSLEGLPLSGATSIFVNGIYPIRDCCSRRPVSRTRALCAFSARACRRWGSTCLGWSSEGLSG